jgi:hypothetical protein
MSRFEVRLKPGHTPAPSVESKASKFDQRYRQAMSGALTERPCTEQTVSADHDADGAAVPSVMIEQ